MAASHKCRPPLVLLTVAMLAIGLDVGVARITCGVALPAFARDLQPSLTAAGLLGTLHLIGYLLGTVASPSLNTKVGVMYGASSIAGAALGSGAIGSLLVVHGENWSVFAAAVLVGLGSVATPAIVTFLIRSRTSDAACPSSLRSAPRAWFAAAVYGAGMLATADGFFGRTRAATGNLRRCSR